MGIDGTWRRDCSMEDVSQTGARLRIEDSKSQRVLSLVIGHRPSLSPLRAGLGQRRCNRPEIRNSESVHVTRDASESGGETGQISGRPNRDRGQRAGWHRPGRRPQNTSGSSHASRTRRPRTLAHSSASQLSDSQSKASYAASWPSDRTTAATLSGFSICISVRGALLHENVHLMRAARHTTATTQATRFRYSARERRYASWIGSQGTAPGSMGNEGSHDGLT